MAKIIVPASEKTNSIKDYEKNLVYNKEKLSPATKSYRRWFKTHVHPASRLESSMRDSYVVKEHIYKTPSKLFRDACY